MLRKIMPWLVGLLLLGLSYWAVYRAGESAAEAAFRLQQVSQQRDSAAQGLADFVAEAERLHGLSVQLDQRINTLAAARPAIVERYTRETIQNPLPADCRVSPERLRSINAAIAAANAAVARDHDKPVPGDSAAGDK